MPSLRTATAATAATILAIAVPAASAEEVVPPGNSAATQYTEAFPTAGGQRNSRNRSKGGPRRDRSPSAVLGKRAAGKLAARGATGRAAAEAAAATAPPSAVRAAPAVGDAGTEATSPRDVSRQPENRSGAKAPAPLPDPGDSSGPAAAAIGQATGLSSVGDFGPLLPLLIAAAVLWALVYAARQRRRPTA